jgi:prepilin signal peptidase PulO-like enzyme (type II secretory pathway)
MLSFLNDAVESTLALKVLWAVPLWSIIVWIAWVDLKHLRIPIVACVILFALGMLRLVTTNADLHGLFAPLTGAVLTGACLWLVGQAFERIRGNTGLGSMDPPYIAVLALWVDPFLIPWAIMIGCVVTLLIGAVRGKFREGVAPTALKMPFAPGLGIGFGAVHMMAG